MSSDPTDRAAEARGGLVDSIAGKAKEVAGAVTGKDDLTEEGQLQQAEARKRKAALADEAVADAKLREASQELQETNSETAQEQARARAEAAREESVLERQRASEHAAASAEAERQEAIGEEAAEQRADVVAETRLREAEALESDAAATEREAAAAEQRAAQLRAQTDN
jgi:uncharacterized protein YjbJ (UPF0337 family)